MSDVPDQVVFRTSSYSGGGDCVEVGAVPEGPVLIRHSKHRQLVPLPFSREEWTKFVLGVKAGEFDDLGGPVEPA